MCKAGCPQQSAHGNVDRRSDEAGGFVKEEGDREPIADFALGGSR